jgi:hypothetical protein
MAAQFFARLQQGDAKACASFPFKLTYMGNAATKLIAKLTDARKDEDETKVKAAKKLFSDAKKGLKQLLALQRDRLYEAMCTQREWTYRDWDSFLNRHPIISRYCQSLVWVVCTGAQAG